LIQQLTASEGAFQALDELRRIADALHVPVAQIALAWLLAQPTVTSVIIGARTAEQLQQVVGASDLTLSSKEVESLSNLTTSF
jgi:aryl-alcohol dehydrogenase-like predicted oxidoreductase